MKQTSAIFQNKRDTIIPLLLTIGGGIIRFFRLGNNSFWIDELGQLVVSARDLPGIIEGVSYHLSPPLDYLLLHITIAFGQSEFLVRANSAIFGTVTIFFIYHISKRLFNKEIALISSVLLAFSRFHIHFSQEARMYSLFCMLTVISFYLLWMYIEQKKNKYYLLLLFTDLVLLYTHYYGLFVIVSQGLYLGLQFIYPKQEWNFRDFAKQLFHTYFGFLIVGIVYLPWMGTLLTQINRSYNQIIPRASINQNWIHSFVKIFSRASWHTVYSQIITRRFNSIFGTPWPEQLFSPFELIFLLLAIIGIICSFISKKKLKMPVIFLSIWLFLPLLLVTLAGVNLGTRYFIFILPPYLIMISLGIVELKNWFIAKWGQKLGTLTTGLLIVLIGSIVFMSLYDYFFHYEKDDWRGIGEFLEKNAEPADTILIIGGDNSYIKHYYHGSSSIRDADYMYGELAFINTYEDLSDFVYSDGCKWIFVSGHSNNIFSYGEIEIEGLVLKLLRDNMDAVEKVYHQGKYDLPGLYRSLDCKPYQ